MNYLRNFILVLFFSAIACTAWAQKPHFIYLQTETLEPFFVQLNKKNYSSSSIGHVILPALTNGTYTLQVGFSGQNTLQEYEVVIENTDLGFVVKKFEDNSGYGLVNIQTAAVQMSGSARRMAEEAEKQKALAAAAEAQRIENEKAAAEAKRLEEEKAAAEAKKTEEEKAAAVTAAGVAANQKTVEEKIAADASKTGDSKQTGEAAEKKTDNTNKSGVAAAVITGGAVVAGAVISNEKSKEGTPPSSTDKKVDSVVTLPAAVQTENTVTAAQTTQTGAVAAVSAGTLSAAEIAALQEEARRIDAAGKRDSVLATGKAKPAGSAAAPVFLDMDISMPADSASQKISDSASAKVTALAASANQDVKDTLTPSKVQFVAVGDSLVVVRDSVAQKAASESKAMVAASNPNCKAEATDSDVELVSMIIKGEKDPEDALEILKKTVKVKCVTTVQVRKLTGLFATDEHRYALLDLAYRYTSDKNNYSSLADLLTDTYYLNRFKAMLQ